MDVYKTCRIFKKQVQSTDGLAVPLAEWLEYFSFDSYIPGSSRVGHIFFFSKK